MKSIPHVSHIGITSSSRILAIFPHPDDETAFAGGFIRQAANHGATVKLLTLSSGGKSTHRFGLNNTDILHEIREDELKAAAKLLGISSLHLGRFPDGEIENHASKVQNVIKDHIGLFSPDFILTLEPHGVYGHPDHIALTKAVVKVQHSTPSNPQLIFATVDANFTPSPGAKAMATGEVTPFHAHIKIELTKQDTEAKLAALRAHASQFIVDEEFIAKWQIRNMLETEFFHLRPTFS